MKLCERTPQCTHGHYYALSGIFMRCQNCDGIIISKQYIKECFKSWEASKEETELYFEKLNNYIERTQLSENKAMSDVKW